MTDFSKLIPIDAKRTDPQTGREFAFRVVPSDDLRIDEIRLGPPIVDHKDFTIHLFWLAIIGDYIAQAPVADFVSIFPLIKEVAGSFVVSREKAESDSNSIDGYTYRFSMTVSEALLARAGMTNDFADVLLAEVIQSPATQEAMSWYVKQHHDINGHVPLSADIKHSVVVELSQDPDKKARLFVNSKDVNLNTHFAMAKFVADRHNQVIKDLNPANIAKAVEQFVESSPHYPRRRKAVYKTRNQNDDTVFEYDQNKAAIETADQFAKKLQRLKDPKVIQTHFALMKWMNLNDTSVFINVPLSDIMGLVLKPHGTNSFNKEDRQKFSEALEDLARITISVSVIGRRVNPKTGKGKTVLQNEDGVKLFRMKAEYSVKKEFQGMPRESLDPDVHFDRSVINHFSGEILPGNQHMFSKQPGSVYSDTLLRFDANKDGRAVILGFSIQTRFNQLTDKEKFMEVDRAYLIDLCDYQQTDQTKPSRATQMLASTLDKLIKAGIISKYTGLTNKNEDRVKIYPPRQKALPAGSNDS